MTTVLPSGLRASVDAAAFRSAFRHLAGGVTVVTAVGEAGPEGLAATSCTSVSAIPPLVLVSVGAGSATLEAVASSFAFGVSLLRANQCWISRRFATPRLADKFAGVPLVSGMLGVPLIEGALAHLECELHLLVPAGDHVLVLGHVVEATAGERAEPLLYAHGAYHSLGAPVLDL